MLTPKSLFLLFLVLYMVTFKSVFSTSRRVDDMVLTKAQYEKSDTFRKEVNKSERWPNRTFKYKISTQYNKKSRERLFKAMNTLANLSCVRFQEAGPKDKAFAYIRPADGCWSAVGYRGQKQTIGLSVRGCVHSQPIVLHEFLHALGFYHEHCRPERDKYIYIKKSEWVCKNPETFGVSYDLESLLHAGKGKWLPKLGRYEIQPKDPKIKIKKPSTLSKGDILKLNRMYKCDQLK